METALDAAEPDSDARADDRLHLHFALGKAYDDAREYEPAFRHYAAGNAIRSGQLGYRAAETSAAVDAIIAACTPQFFAARAGTGDPAPDPVRSEQHTSELQSLMRISYAVFCLKKKNNT